MELIPQGETPSGLPVSLAGSLKHLVVEKLPSGEAFDLAVRDGKTGFVFFNIEGNLYDYDAKAQLLSVTEGRLLVSKEFANALGQPSGAGSVVGKISIGAAMQPTEITQLANGEPKSVVMPPLRNAGGPEAPTLVPGPDVIVGGAAEFGAVRKRWDASRPCGGNRLLQQTATSRSIGLLCQTTITQSFRKISTA